MKIRNCFCRRTVHIKGGEEVVQIIFKPEVGRQLRSEAKYRDKVMSQPLSDGHSVSVHSTKSLKPFLKMYHQADRRCTKDELNKLVQSGGYQADLPGELVIFSTLEQEEDQDSQDWATGCRAVSCGWNGVNNIHR